MNVSEAYWMQGSQGCTIMAAYGIPQLIKRLSCWLENWRIAIWFLEWESELYFLSSVQTGCGSIHPPIQLIVVIFPLGKASSAWSWLLSSIVSKLWMGGVTPLLPNIRLWGAEGQFDFHLFHSDCFLSLSIFFSPSFLYSFYCFIVLLCLFYSFHFYSATLFIIFRLIRLLVCHNALCLD